MIRGARRYRGFLRHRQLFIVWIKYSRTRLNRADLRDSLLLVFVHWIRLPLRGHLSAFWFAARTSLQARPAVALAAHLGLESGPACFPAAQQGVKFTRRGVAWLMASVRASGRKHQLIQRKAIKSSSTQIPFRKSWISFSSFATNPVGAAGWYLLHMKHTCYLRVHHARLAAASQLSCSSTAEYIHKLSKRVLES